VIHFHLTLCKQQKQQQLTNLECLPAGPTISFLKPQDAALNPNLFPATETETDGFGFVTKH
jgi:hypothetical protein